MKSVTIFSGHGIGDAILGLQCANFVDNDILIGPHVQVVACCRDEVYNVLREAFGDHYYPTLSQHVAGEKWGENNWILQNQKEIESYGFGSDEVYYVIPDLLHRNPLAFDWRKYRASPQTIKATRLLTRRWEPQKRIYVGLASSHKDYQFKAINHLLVALGSNFPDYEIYYPNLQTWNGAKIPFAPEAYQHILPLPENVIVDSECKVEDTVEKLRTSDYGIFVDNGFSHLAYQFGVPRLVLDNHYGNPAFSARWRENEEDYIPYTEKIDEITSVVYNNLTEPATLLINKNWCKTTSADWAKVLVYKF